MNIDDIIKDSSFTMLEGKVDGRILKNLMHMGFQKPTRIQAESLPYILLEKDVIGAAKTGSGKTLAFLIPVIERLIKLGFSRKHGTGCIILSPTRELALQTFHVLKKVLTDIELSHGLIVGGEKKAKDLVTLKKGVNIVVSTPGRLLDHLQNTEHFNVTNLKCLVVDEADKLLEAGFERHITGIIKLLPKKHYLSHHYTNTNVPLSDIELSHGLIVGGEKKDKDLVTLKKENRQTILFSATMDSNVKNLARLALREDPVVISTDDQTKSTVTGLQQGYYVCPVEQKLAWLYKMLKKCKKLKVMVFFSSCKSVDFHYEFFRNHCKASILSIHGRQSQARRKEAYQNFVEAQNGALFCTDVAARGLNIPSVDWIVQYDPPTDPKEYIHRVGRTARGLNNKGNAVLLLRSEEEEFLSFLKKEKVFLDKYSFDAPSEEIQRMLEELILKNGVMKLLARKAYLSFLRCYKAHPLKKIFNINNLDVNLAAKAFGFLETPHIDFLNSKKKKSKTSKKQKESSIMKT